MNSKAVLDIFKEITTVPRESGKEALIQNWLMNWAEKRGFNAKKDKVGNVLITREASKGKENIPTIVLQAHQDMVCEKLAGSSHDFNKEPIKYIVKDGWMIAEETTLGADDGIGIASALALIEDTSPKGRIECLFTVSEETGMDGAFGMEEGFFEGKTLLNLDSEDEGQIFIGCAGGVNTDTYFNLKYSELPKSNSSVKISISGGIGGHSGDDINKGRANAIKLLLRFVYKELGNGAKLCDFNGGGRHNAIPRAAECTLWVEDSASLSRRFDKFAAAVREEFHNTDPVLVFKLEKTCADKCIEDKLAKAIIASLLTCPHGVVSMNQDIEGLVQTSNNLANVHIEGDRLLINNSQRSSSVDELDSVADMVTASFENAGGISNRNSQYPGWNPDMNSKILTQSVASYKKLFNTDPEVKAIHAGLECGLFLEKFPGLDMISIGPTLRGVHAPGERLDLESLDKFVLFLDDIVCNFK